MKPVDAIIEEVSKLRDGSLISVEDFNYEVEIVHKTLDALCEKGELVRAKSWEGIYYKGEVGRWGMRIPSHEAVGFWLAGKGAGFSDISSLNQMGLTTQVPAICAIAVPGSAPNKKSKWVRFKERPESRKTSGLSIAEITIIEGIKFGDDWEGASRYDLHPWIENGYEGMRKSISNLMETHSVSLLAIWQQILKEGEEYTMRKWVESIKRI